MLEAFRRRFLESRFLDEGQSVLVGYSGGADSTCLLDLLVKIGVPVVAAHLHHGQRPEADEEMENCAAFCDQLGVPFVTGRADVPRLAKDRGMGLEEAGRSARYGFFRQAAGQTGCSVVATGHTEDDQVETVLLNLGRGTGLAGLGGIPERRDGIIRPLLSFSRVQTLAWCQDHGLWFHSDPSNADLSFSRARIRHRVVPELELACPGLRHSVERLSRLADEEDRFLNGMAAAALEKAERRPNGALAFLTLDCEIELDQRELAVLPSVLLARALRLAAGALGGSLDYRQTEVAAAGVQSCGEGSVTSEGGEAVLSWGHGRVHAHSARPDVPFRWTLTVPGETISDEFGWTIFAHPSPDEDPRSAPEDLKAVLDARSLQGQLYFRTAQAGDVLSPLGMEGRKKVFDIMGEMGLTRAAKARLPLVCDMVGPVWIPGGPIADRVKVTAETLARLVLRLAPNS